MRFIKLLSLILIVTTTSISLPANAKKWVRKNKLYPISEGEMINHKYYSLSYAEEYENAYWVFYKINKDFIDGTAKRNNYFMTDSLVSTGSATFYDYKGSGYDKGHLCPAAAMKLNQEAMDETFYMSNMSPQHPQFNQLKWRELEEQVRDWINDSTELYVVSGPIFTEIIEYVGENQVAVPGAYYKVIWDGDKRMIGFIMPNEKCEKPLQDYVVSVDSIEEITHINFFSKIPNRIEKVIEKNVNIEAWNF